MKQANAARRVCMKRPKVDCSKIVDFFPLIDCIEGFGGWLWVRAKAWTLRGEPGC